MSNATKEELQWTLVAAALALPQRLGAACAVFGLIALAGYFGNVHILYRPIAGGPATHPLTALCVLLLGLGVSASRPTKNGIQFERIFALTALGITVCRLAEAAFGTEITAWITPFHGKVLLDQHMGGKNAMGCQHSLYADAPCRLARVS
ncbi:MAG: hypothetical protein ACTS6O_14610 [Giesbergeria sp.]